MVWCASALLLTVQNAYQLVYELFVSSTKPGCYYVTESTLEHPIKEELLLCFLRARKYNADRAFKSVNSIAFYCHNQLNSFLLLLLNWQLKNYFKMAKNYPELFTNLSAFKLRFQLKEQLQVVYKSRDKQGRRIFIFRAGITSIGIFSIKSFRKFWLS